jgi:hypothetical protein
MITKPVISAEETNEGWVNMFDGKSLAGWEALSNPHVWSVQNGVIVGRHTASVGDDFLPSLLFHMNSRCRDLSIYFRAAFVPQFARAYIAQANNTGEYPQRTGSLYNFVPVDEQLVEDDTWWTQHVIAQGNHIRILVNGMETVNFADTENNHTEGYLALLHFIPG